MKPHFKMLTLTRQTLNYKHLSNKNWLRYCSSNPTIPRTFNEIYKSRDMNTGKYSMNIGDYTTATKQFTQNDIKQYALLTGDNNDIHLNDESAQEYGYNKIVCHGMFSGALFSTAVGMNLPGAILVTKTLKWLKPIYSDEIINAKVEIIKILKSKQLIICSMEAKNENNDIVVIGEVTLKIRDLKTD
mmetsp:Transcript_76793/g.94260  ORF Transcript_76793/g.94260 Transcript_76793/m.94260 type:complete len:187 (-) Transcript_76793:483-1043(-)